MELERIDVKNVKELDKRCVVCTFQPTLSLNKEWVMSLATMVIAQDFEKIAQLEVQDSSFETFVLCADMDCRQTVYDLFENAKLQTMQLERLFLEGYSRKLDCTIRMEFSLSDGKNTNYILSITLQVQPVPYMSQHTSPLSRQPYCQQRTY